MAPPQSSGRPLATDAHEEASHQVDEAPPSAGDVDDEVDEVDERSRASFPASDPPASW